MTLSPLYDFAPMFLDEQMIPRACKWSDADDYGIPNWEKVFRYLETLDIDYELFVRRVKKWKMKFDDLLQAVKKCEVEPELIERIKPKIQEVQKGLHGIG